MAKLVLNGRIIRGINQAVRCFNLQRPNFIRFIPQIAGYHMGTINIELDNNLIISNPDFITSPIKWSTDPPEVFGFLNVNLIIQHPYQKVDSQIYIPYDSVHRNSFKIHEIITTTLKFNIGDLVSIEIDKPFKELSYRHNISYLII